jgi:conjugal transfer pilus assembly protein TraF
MIKAFLIFLLFLNTAVAAGQKPVGFLWYSIEQKPQKAPQSKAKGIAFKQLSFTERDAILHFYTMEALHKARYTKKVEDMRVFLSLQEYWLSESTRFRSLFQQTMLAYPQYDYQVTHPTSNLGVKITDELRQKRQIHLVQTLSKTHGLLFFYRGKSPYDVKQIPIIADFCKRFHLSLMPVSVDGVTSYELSNSRLDQGQANHLGVRYFPATLLVNPQSGQISPIAYGLVTQDVLLERIQAVATHFKEEV